MKAVKEIGQIKVHNRGDCCGERLSAAVVEILDANKKVVWSAKIEKGENGKIYDFVKK